MQQRKSRAATWLVAVGLGIAAVQGTGLFPQTLAQAADNAAQTWPGVTRPSEERLLAFGAPGVVREVLVKEGDQVKAGQPLLRLDSRIDKNQLEALLVEANSTLKVDYAEKELAQKKVQLERKQQLHKDAAASETELEEAILNAALADTRLALSKEENQLKKLEAGRQQVKVDLLQVTSTVDGIVQKISMKEGEFVDPQQSSQRPAVVVVKNDPLKIEVFVPTPLASRFTHGQELEVSYAGEEKWQKAKITFFDPVADAGSGMRRLHLELPNSSGREAGWQVNVRLPQ